MRTEVYSWRLSRELKTDVERAARLRKEPVSSILEMAVRDWLQKSAAENGEDAEEQRRLHAAAEACFGTMSSGKRIGSENVREAVRERLKKRYGR